MKKLIYVFLAMLCFVTVIGCEATNGYVSKVPSSSSDGTGTTSGNVLYNGSGNIPFFDNSPYGYNAICSILPSTYKAVVGDVLTITITGSSNTALDGLSVALIDNGPNTAGAGSYGWVELSTYYTILGSYSNSFSKTVKLTVTANSTAAGADYNKIVLSCGTGTASAPTLTISTFKIVLD
ncbi:MAG TPA: hypothetical protein PKO22_08650 [Treponemataceae bacterium]|nr:hypothetical protein [Treponemataceae bacterium]